MVTSQDSLTAKDAPNKQAVSWLGVEPATIKSRVRRPDHQAIKNETSGTSYAKQ